MGKLAELAQTKALKGKVTVTCMDTGESRTYKNEADAEAALPKGAKVEHRRGAFFYGDATGTQSAEPERGATSDASSEDSGSKPRKKSSRSKRSSED